MGSTPTARTRHRLRTITTHRHPPQLSSETPARTPRPGPRDSNTTPPAHRHRKHGHRLALLLCFGILATMTPSPASAHTLDTSRRQYGAILPDDYYRALGRCETAGNLKHSSRSYTGIFGIYRGTAYRWSGKRDLSGLTMRQQIRIADRIAFSGYTRKDGRYVWPVGPFGWGAVSSGCSNLLEHICHSRHKRVQKHRARACKLARQHG